MSIHSLGMGSLRSAVFVALVAALLVLAGCGSKAGAATVDMKDFKFTPDQLVINTGDTVIWKNPDVEPHTITSATWDSGAVKPGDSYTREFDNAGTYDYRCVVHPDMIGRITVTERTTRY